MFCVSVVNNIISLSTMTAHAFANFVVEWDSKLPLLLNEIVNNFVVEWDSKLP